MNLERNVGGLDKKIRIGAGAVLILIGLFKSLWLAIIGVIVLATGLLGFCGLYKLLGLNTASPAEIAVSSDDPVQRVKDSVDEIKREATEFADVNKDGKVDAEDAKQAYHEAAAKVKEGADTLADKGKEVVDKIKNENNKHS